MKAEGRDNRMPHRVTFNVIAEADIADVAAYLARQARPGDAVMASPMPPERRLRWLLLENPARTPDVPLGWCIRDAGRKIVGALLCVPFRVSARGVTRTALMSCKFFVDEPYRGAGLVPFRSYLKLGGQYPLFCTSANAVSGELFAGAGGYAIGGTDHAMLGIARHAPLAEEWLFRRTGRSVLSRVGALPARLLPGRSIGRAEGELRSLASAEEVVALDLPPPGDAIAVVRDHSYLRWRYFWGESANEVFCFRGVAATPRMVVVNQVRSGHRSQIRVLNVPDVWPPLDADSAPRLTRLLWQRYRGHFDALWLRSQPPSAEAALRRSGFVRHLFPAPLGWCVDELKLPTTRDWYLMPGESE